MYEYIDAFKRYFVFSGRTSRRGYWMFIIPLLLLSYFLSGVLNTIFISRGMGLNGINFYLNFIYLFYIIFVFIPILAVSVRRLHDINKRGWYILINLIPLVGLIWFLFLMIKKGNDGSNNYGVPYSKSKNSDRVIDPVISTDENISNKKVDNKPLRLLSWMKNNKKSAIIISIIFFIFIIIPASMILGVKIISNVKCGDGGYLNGNSNKGYNCSYSFVNPEFSDISQCQDSNLFCSSKGREVKNGCGSAGVDLTNRLKVNENGGFYTEEGPVVCSYCCGSDVNKNNIIENNSNELDSVLNNSVDIGKEIVNKSVTGNFKKVDSDETFNYTEKYSPKEWNVNTRNYNWNTVNECADFGCNFVYFANYNKNLLMFTSLDVDQDKTQGKLALFSDRDNPLIGEITKVVFYVGGNKISGFPKPTDRHVDVFYTISHKEDGILKSTNRIEQNMCDYDDYNSICNPIVKKIGDRIIFFYQPDDNHLRSIFLFNEMIKTQMKSFKIINE